MASKERPLTLAEAAHVAGRAAMAIAIAWGYLAVVLWLDVAGLATWARETPEGLVVVIQIAAMMGVAFGCTGAYIGEENVRGRAAMRAVSEEATLRRVEARTWVRRR